MMASTKEPNPAEQALEIEKLRKQIEALTAAAATPPAQSLTAQTETDAGIEVRDIDGKLVETQMWWYTINLPPSGGDAVTINGFPFHHGEQYKISTPTLASLKEVVFRSWRQEDIISGADENPYRKQTAAHFNHGRRVA